jgi:ABC-type branched-subunit amino acid transport system ATPase component
MDNPLLQIKALKKSFDGLTPIKNVNFELPAQSITLITGGNGAGKTTLFNLISGLEKPTEGSIFFENKDITHLSTLQVAQAGIVRLYQQPRLFKNLQVWENLVAAAAPNDGDKITYNLFQYKKTSANDKQLREKAVSLLTGFGLAEFSSRNAGELSYGQQKLISFCMLAMNGAKLGLLDEPFAGLNPQMIDKLSEMTRTMQSRGTAFLLIEHNLQKALALSDAHWEMSEGTIKQV